MPRRAKRALQQNYCKSFWDRRVRTNVPKLVKVLSQRKELARQRKKLAAQRKEFLCGTRDGWTKIDYGGVSIAVPNCV